MATPFGTIPELTHGTFYRGWLLLLRAERARLAETADPGLAAEADAAAALVASPTGVPPSYPRGYWPCDAVVAMAGVAEARAALGRPHPESATWLAKLERLRDRTTGLLPHRNDATGRTLEGPQGSSQSLIATSGRACRPPLRVTGRPTAPPTSPPTSASSGSGSTPTRRPGPATSTPDR